MVRDDKCGEAKSTIMDVCFASKILPGAEFGENAAAGKLETFDFTYNSTNITHFAYGIAATVFSMLLYGSNFVPLKRIETGDGKRTAI